MTHYVNMEVCLFTQSVSSQYSVVIFRFFRSAQSILIWSVTKKLILLYGWFNTPSNATSEAKVTIHRICGNEYIHSKLVCNEKDSCKRTLLKFIKC